MPNVKMPDGKIVDMPEKLSPDQRISLNKKINPRLNLKDKCFCVFDYGLFPDLAVKLSEQVGRVLYFKPWKISPYPTSTHKIIGDGMEGVERIDKFWNHIDEVDCFVFPYIYDSDTQLHLRSLGKRVFGSGMGDALEIERWEMKKYFESVGLPVPKSRLIKGMENLRLFLKSHEDKMVKIVGPRGDMESFHHRDYKSSLPWLDELAYNVGPMNSIMIFIVEDMIEPAIETGSDWLNIDGKFSEYGMYGYEIKDSSYVLKVSKYGELPDAIREVNDQLAPLLKRYQYRNFISTEIRVTKDCKPYPIDITTRMGSPPGESIIRLIENLPEIFWFGSEGKLIEPSYSGQFAAQIFITSESVLNNWTEVSTEKRTRPWVNIPYLSVINGSEYVAPDPYSSEVASVVGIGNTLKEAIKKCEDRIKDVSAYMMVAPTDAFDKTEEVIEEGRRCGIAW